MRNYLLAAAAAAVFATPAMARDGSGYVGIEGGVLFPKKQHIDADSRLHRPGWYRRDLRQRRPGSRTRPAMTSTSSAATTSACSGSRASLATSAPSLKNATVDNAFLTGVQHAVGQQLHRRRRSILAAIPACFRAWSTGSLDFGGNGGVGAYAGGGFGRARVKQLGDSDNAWAYQLLAGVYMPISDNIDVGLKYRYFRTGKLNFNDEFAFSPVGTTCGALACSGGTAFFNSGGPFQLAQPARQPDLQLRRPSGRRGAGHGRASAAAASGSGDPDVPGRFGHSRDQQLPGSAAAAATAGAGRARRTRPLKPPFPLRPRAGSSAPDEALFASPGAPFATVARKPQLSVEIRAAVALAKPWPAA